MLKKIIITIIILGAIGAVVYVVRGNDKGTEYVTAQVTRGTLTQSVEATGKVESAERIDLNFRTTGRISEMSVNVGDTVRANAILARLDSRALTSKVADARARVDKEKADYQKLLAGASDADIKVAEDTAEQKLQDLKAAQNTRDSLMPKRDTELANLK
ncbi:MAG: hypothetical protein QGG82_01835, partial [Patescibacteria group bacterium]|nr:hypothetical protein [Patescibacteria group bacterium]